ncbi:MAG TPA: SAM-dependent methyltransferase [Acidimicrobiales bacterium]|nr:SAM-dependent methyltransferase [Acidimicrobiales bacterium]
MIGLEPIGWVHSSRTEAVDDDWDAVVSTIDLDPRRFGPAALQGLEAFSHIDVVFLFDRVGPEDVETGARHPRSNPHWPEVGIFAQRAKMRPNRLGVTTCALRAVEGLTLSVRGLDAIDGTPVLDIKPYMVEFGPRGAVHQPAWSGELMRGYWRSGSDAPTDR